MSSAYEHELSLSLQRAIAIVPKVFGALSLIACSAILRDVSIKWHGKRSVSLTSVIVFCISIADWLYSLFSAFLGVWMVPADTGRYMAAGNTASCTAQGFITALSIGSSMSYYCVLVIVFWLMLQPGWTEKHLSKLGVRLSFVLPPFIISLAIATPALFLEMYNHSGLHTCFLAPKPFDCEFNASVECERGRNAWIYWDFFWVYAMIMNLIIVVFVSMLVYAVFKQERKMDKYLTPGQERRRVNTIKTAWQGLRYIIAFMMAYITLYVLTFYRHAGKTAPLSLVFAHLVLVSSLGVFNSFVYFRPRYIAYRDSHPNDSRIICLGNVFNVDLDYLDSRRENLSKRLSSISRKSIASLKTSSLSGTVVSDRAASLSGGSVEDSDLTSPLFRDSEEANDDDEGV